VGEFALMVNGEGWLTNQVKCRLKIIPVANYAHDMPYTLPVSPSPNLNTQQAVLLYPSTCMFEGTYLNHGRGTYFPFTVLGSPELKGDRKSTRLNSSHVKISYAVFCWKKKKRRHAH